MKVKPDLVILTTHFGTNFSGGSLATAEIFSRIQHDFSNIIVIGTKIGKHEISNLDFHQYHGWTNAISQLKKNVRRNRVYFGDFFNSILLAHLKLPFVFTYHDNWPGLGFVNEYFNKECSFYWPIYQNIFKAAKSLIAVSDHSGRQLSKYGHFEIVRNGFNEIKHSRSKRQNILMVGSIDKRKYGLAIEMFNGWDSNLKVDIYGRILDKALFEELTSFNFVSYQGYRDQIPYTNYKMLLHISFMENLPIVFCESISSKTPVLAWDVGASSEVINSTNGRLIPAYDIEKMRQAINVANTLQFEFNTPIDQVYNWALASEKYSRIIRSL